MASESHSAFSDDTPVVSLRYFKADGPFAQLLHAEFALALPAVGRAMRVTIAGEEAIALWRSPTETLLVSAPDAAVRAVPAAAVNRTPFAPLRQRLAASGDGCCIDQTGGIVVTSLSGDRVRELLLRLGGTTSLPAAGEARATRLADIPAVAVSVGTDETLLLVERVHADHLYSYMRSIAADLS